MIDKKIVFTYHAKERFGECRFKSESQAIDSFKNSVEDTGISKYKDIVKHKEEKYSEQKSTKYSRNGTIIFTYTEKTDKFSHDDIYLIITVTNQLASSGVKV
ncbi:MAG: hypothetical protein WC479_03135 [Candidatus Izemoplasmatales bacterium]